MEREYKNFRDSKGTLHEFKKKSEHRSKDQANIEKRKWKDKHYKVRVVPAMRNGKDIYKVFAFALWD